MNKYLVLFFIVTTTSCQSQQLVQKPMDIYILCQREDEFIGKTLRALLDELKPTIKIVFAEGGWAEKAPQFFFFFMSKQGFDSCRKQGNLPLRLNVYVKDFFQWTYENRRHGNYLLWTKKDEENYGNLIITALRVTGDCDPCETESNVNL
jgi:hypothetical protein